MSLSTIHALFMKEDRFSYPMEGGDSGAFQPLSRLNGIKVCLIWPERSLKLEFGIDLE